MGSMFFFCSSRRRHTRFDCDWSSDVCSSDLCPSRAEAMNTADTLLELHWIPRNVDMDQMARRLEIYRSEEHTSELQSQSNLVCRLLLEKKKNTHHSRAPPL